MTADNPITGLLSAPLCPDWTIDGLAEEVLSTIAAQPTSEGQEIVLDTEAATDRQAQRILRPLLACLATKSAAEPATSPNLCGGRLSFQRTDPEGQVWIVGHFDNRSGMVRAVLRRSTTRQQNPDPKPAELGGVIVPSASHDANAAPADEQPPRTPPDGSGLAEKRRRAEAWAADYAGSASASQSSRTFSQHLETMYYEIGRICRNDWSHRDAEGLLHLQRVGGFAAGSTAGALVSSFLPAIGPAVGRLFGAIAGVLSGPNELTPQKLVSASKSIIEHFESECSMGA